MVDSLSDMLKPDVGLDLTCPACKKMFFYGVSEFPSEAVCKKCGKTFPLSEDEKSAILFLQKNSDNF